MRTSTPYLANLTPLRGIAALLTVVFHVDLFLGGGNVLLKFDDSLFISRLYLMVDFFFVLSGFILCHVYGNYFQDGVTGRQFKRFTMARLARIYPLYLFSLLLTATVLWVAVQLGLPEVPVAQIENSAYSFVTNLLMLQAMNLHGWFTFTHAAWSVSTEWWMYMLFPFLVLPFSRFNAWGRIGMVVACYLGYVAITFWLVPIVTIPESMPYVRVNPADMSINVAYQYGFLRCMLGFIIGMMVYAGYREDWGRNWLGSGTIFLLLALGLGACLHYAVPDVFTLVFIPFLLLSAAYGSPRLNALFWTNPLQKLGDWSYSIYLTHQPLMNIIGTIMAYLNPPDPTAAPGPPPLPDQLTGWLICLVFIVITLLVSYMTYRFIEVPARKWINERWKKHPTAYSALVD